MPLTTASNSTPSWEVAEALENRLRLGVTDPALAAPKPAGFIRWMTSPDLEDGAAFKAEEGIHLVLGDPQPTTLDGAGRAGKRVRRVIQAWIVTRNMQDRAGDARIALKQHLALEDLVFDSLDDFVPDGTVAGQQAQVGITVHWIPGGDEVRRKAKVAPDTFVSVHLFEIKYKQNLRVVRATF